MTDASLLGYAITACGVMASTVCGLLIYIFVQQRANINKIEASIDRIYSHNVKKSDFTKIMDSHDVRVEGISEDLQDLEIRVVKLETSCEARKRASCDSPLH